MLNMNTVICGNIMKQLKKNGKKQIDLAQGLGVSKQVMSKMLNGSRTINAVELRDIAAYFHITMEELVAIPKDIVETNAIRAFMGSVRSDEARKGLEIADELADMILFYARTRENAEYMMEPWEE